MKKYLLPETGNFYKANMHCHTTVSDGRLTPEEVKPEYKYIRLTVFDKNNITATTNAYFTDELF